MVNSQISGNKYEIPTDELKDLITSALRTTLSEVTPNDSNDKPGKDHHTKSQNWVKYLALEIERYYNDEKGYDLVSFFNRRKPSINSSLDDVKEFLFDITVAEIKSIKGSSLSFISRPVWQIESEFAELLKETIRDFQKLISGNAPFKMMVGPLNPNNDSSEYRKITQVPASYISGNLFFLFITHPENWKKGEEMIWKLYKWNVKDWGEIIAKDKWNIESENRSPF